MIEHNFFLTGDNLFYGGNPSKDSVKLMTATEYLNKAAGLNRVEKQVVLDEGLNYWRGASAMVAVILEKYDLTDNAAGITKLESYIDHVKHFQLANSNVIQLEKYFSDKQARMNVFIVLLFVGIILFLVYLPKL